MENFLTLHGMYVFPNTKEYILYGYHYIKLFLIKKESKLFYSDNNK